MKKSLARILKKLTFIDYIGMLVIGVLGLAAFFFFLRKPVFVDIRVKVTDQDVLYARNNPSPAYADRFFTGDTEKDALGRKTAEITNVQKYSENVYKTIVYLDVSTRATYDKRAGLYYVKGKPLIFGSPIRFNFSTVIFDGIVTELPEPYRKSFYDVANYEVVVLLKGVTSSFNIEGILTGSSIEPEVVRSVRKGDKIIDSNSNVLIEIVENSIRPSTRVVTNGRGGLVTSPDPYFIDGLITLRARAKTLGDEVYVIDDIPLKINNSLPLIFSHVSVYPAILSFKKL